VYALWFYLWTVARPAKKDAMKSRKGLYVYPAGVSSQVSGLEIKDRETAAQKKENKKLKGAFVPGRGFFESLADAYAALDVQRLLLALQAKQAKFLHF
jgi:hypothetical protein